MFHDDSLFSLKSAYFNKYMTSPLPIPRTIQYDNNQHHECLK